MIKWRGIEKMPRVYDALSGDGAGMAKWRTALLADVHGDVLELGTGTGHNLAFYPPHVNLIASEFAPQNVVYAAHKRPRHLTNFVGADAQALPFSDARFDHVVATLVLCSVDSQATALGEIRRVLRPDGTLRLIEHTLANNPLIDPLLHLVEQPWCWAAGGCHPNRDTAQTLIDHGWNLLQHRRASAGLMRLIIAQRSHE